MSFPANVENNALVSCGRCCCICHRFCGTKMELHHIKQKANGGEDTFENCIPLCFNCHADMGKADLNHPKGKHYSETELKMHRDKWYKRVENYQNFNTVCPADIKQFDIVCEIFQQVEYWLVEHDMGEPVPKNKFDHLFDLYYREEDPFLEFIDPDLEIIRKKLVDHIKDFTLCFSSYMFPQECPTGSFWVSHFWLAAHEEIPKPDEKGKEQFESEVNKLNSLATELWEIYKDFVRQVRFLIEKTEKSSIVVE